MAQSIEPNGKTFIGPPIGIAQTRTATVNAPLELTLWTTDKGPEVEDEEAAPNSAAGRGGQQRPRLTVKWVLHRGANTAKFDTAEPKVEGRDGGKSTTMATFTQPGDYIVRAQVNDITGDGGNGNQCCWTNVLVRVTVK